MGSAPQIRKTKKPHFVKSHFVSRGLSVPDTHQHETSLGLLRERKGREGLDKHTLPSCWWSKPQLMKVKAHPTRLVDSQHHHVSPEISWQHKSCCIHFEKDWGEDEEEEIELAKPRCEGRARQAVTETPLNYSLNYNDCKWLLLCLIICTLSCETFSWPASKFVGTIFWITGFSPFLRVHSCLVFF